MAVWPWYSNMHNLTFSTSDNQDPDQLVVRPGLDTIITILFVCLFVCFVALRPKATAMVIAGRSVHLATLFPGQA